MDEELSPSAAAARIGATTRSVQRWIAEGRLPARRVGGRWRVAIGAIDALGVRSADSAIRNQPLRPIRSVFVANRGEIAARIQRTTTRLGIRAIIPPTEGPGSVDLLSVEAVVSAAREVGADAVHPGFGFLAESPKLAEAVVASGLAWVGPPPRAIRAMGDKASARRLALQLDIPVVPGYDAADQSDAALTAAADSIGRPLLVKPAAGGGGKGMHVVRGDEEFLGIVASARREAKAAFGDERLILERLVEHARHVEVQVLFDEFGSGIHLGERDCSVQRRHQKVLEETPSPGIDGTLRARLTRAALALAGEVGYASAGTCEFLVDDAGNFYFLEMNTRLQVEHPVTEAVTGRDLVEDQIRIAAGEPLGVSQDEVGFEGHAIEGRIYAEDPESGFLPATGTIAMLRWPSHEGIRVDAGVVQGAHVSDRFDPMLAKVIAHGDTRAAAFDSLAAALDEVLILGITTNVAFLRWLVRHPIVVAGEARIDTLQTIWPDRSREAQRLPDDAWTLAASVLGGGWRLNSAPVARLESEGIVRAVPVEPEVASGRAWVEQPDGEAVYVDVDGRSVTIARAAPPDVDRAARSAASHGPAGAALELIAPMPGAVVGVHTVVGASVEAGDPIVTLEAMKMEHVVAAPFSGVVNEVRVREGDQVARGEILGVIDPAAPTTTARYAPDTKEAAG
jgi:excisionase family DNA binding protein